MINELLQNEVAIISGGTAENNNNNQVQNSDLTKAVTSQQPCAPKDDGFMDLMLSSLEVTIIAGYIIYCVTYFRNYKPKTQ